MRARESAYFWVLQLAIFSTVYATGKPTQLEPAKTAMPRAVTMTSTTSWHPLITGFTPPPECSSLTIVHRQRYVGVFQGCYGHDESCCPPESLRGTDAYSPGRCPVGYATQDHHVGLDRLGTDTEEWEATCVMSGFSSCTRPLWEMPGARNRRCSMPYTSNMPALTSALTAVVIYYEPYDSHNSAPLSDRSQHNDCTLAGKHLAGASACYDGPNGGVDITLCYTLAKWGFQRGRPPSPNTFYRNWNATPKPHLDLTTGSLAGHLVSRSGHGFGLWGHNISHWLVLGNGLPEKKPAQTAPYGSERS